MLQLSLNSSVPDVRIRNANDYPHQPAGQHALSWMIASRRATWNYSLDRASDRLHAFVIQGMADNERSFARLPVTYYPYVDRSPGEVRGLVAALAREACVVVTGDFLASVEYATRAVRTRPAKFR